MPAARLALRLLGALLGGGGQGEERGGRLGFLLLLLALLPVLLLALVPLLVAAIPMGAVGAVSAFVQGLLGGGSPDQEAARVQQAYMQAVQAVYQTTAGQATDKRGVLVDWMALAAIDAVRYGQDTSQVSEQEAEQLAWRFVERHEQTACTTGSDGKQACHTAVTYTLRPLDPVLAGLGLAGADAEQVQVMILALQDLTNTPSGPGAGGDYTPDPQPGWTWPVPGYTTITSPFGWRVLNGQRDFHPGLDIAVPLGTTVLAAHAGTVTESRYDGACGNALAIAWPGGEVRYCHNAALLVPVGTEVALGQPVSLSGSTGESTGPHLHVETYQHGQLVDPLSVFGSAGAAGYTP
ncbi:MAG: M23 family metallopeptidase [Firmicutes bacterium]|nr:M23 family metallopeptidase [Bacillota bacterium]